MTEIVVSFPAGSVAEKSRLASDLTRRLQNLEGIVAKPKREHSDAQNSGELISIILAAPAVIALVEAIAAWLVRTNQTSVVLETGTGVTHVKKGDRVMATTSFGAFAEEVVTEANEVYAIPDAMDFETAASFPVAYGTSHVGLKRRAELKLSLIHI